MSFVLAKMAFRWWLESCINRFCCYGAQLIGWCLCLSFQLGIIIHRKNFNLVFVSTVLLTRPPAFQKEPLKPHNVTSKTYMWVVFVHALRLKNCFEILYSLVYWAKLLLFGPTLLYVAHQLLLYIIDHPTKTQANVYVCAWSKMN